MEKTTLAVSDELLRDRRVIEEINRHLWIESEKVGFDIGFEKASKDWLENFSKVWLDYHAPQRKSSSKDSSKIRTPQGSSRTKARK